MEAVANNAVLPFRSCHTERLSCSALTAAALRGGTAIVKIYPESPHRLWSANIAENTLIAMARRSGGTVAVSAILLIDSEVSTMTQEQFERESRYRVAMSVAKSMFSEGLVSENEYITIDTIFLEKYCPISGGLTAQIHDGHDNHHVF